MAAALPAIGPPTTRVVLRDGSTAGVRRTVAADAAAMRRFFDDLSPTSRRLRFLAPAVPTDDLIQRLCDNRDPQTAVTLIVSRRTGDDGYIVGVGSYFATGERIAEVAFAVDDEFHGKGIATALLERLVRLGVDHGFESFKASVLPENFEMLDVFRDSGFEVHSTNEQGTVEVRLSLESSSASVAAADERDRQATLASLRAILTPKSVAVIGASRNQANLGRRVLDALLDAAFTGPVYAVNSSAWELNGRPCHRTVRDLPVGIDLAIIAVPRASVIPVVDDCAAIGVKGIVVISAGFAETDATGRELQNELVERVRGFGMRMVGPNCMGVINTDPAVRLNASFAEQFPKAGRIALASQSGGLGLAVLNLAARRQLGLSTFVSLGNKADISGNDLLQYAEHDPGTSVVLPYLESFGNPGRFGQLARRISRSKPIVVVKAGRTPAGFRAASSHTAGLAASDSSVDGLFQQAGVIRADTIDEMFDVAVCLDSQPLPKGRRVAIITNAGGPGILAADACAAAGLDVPSTAADMSNPLDLMADSNADAYREKIGSLLDDQDVDALLVIYTSINREHTPAVLAAISAGVTAGRRAGATQPVVICSMASPETAPLHAGAESLPVYEFPEQAARALGKCAAYAMWRSSHEGVYVSFEHLRIREARDLCRQIARERNDTWLTSEELHQLLTAVDLRLAPGVVAHSADEAAALARVFGFPVVAKITSARALHKTEVGGVRLHLANEDAVRSACAELTAIARSQLGDPGGVLIQPMVKGGVETLVGLTRDPTFGPLIAFGVGGIHVDLYRDVSFRIAPLTDRDADELMRSVRGFALLQGYRNQPPADIRALRDVLLKLSYLGAHVPEVVELEFNPLIVLEAGRGYQLVDVRARVMRQK